MERPQSWAASPALRATATKQTMREVGLGGRRGQQGWGVGRRRSATAHSSQPVCSSTPSPPLRSLFPSPAPSSGRRGGAGAPRPTPPQITKLPPTPPTKLLSHRAAPGDPPRADLEQLRTFAAEKDNRRPLPRRRRLETAAAQGRSKNGGLRGARELLRSCCSGSALPQHTTRVRPRMRRQRLGDGRATRGG